MLRKVVKRTQKLFLELQISRSIRLSYKHRGCSDSLLFGGWGQTKFSGATVGRLTLTRNFLVGL